MRVLLTGHKGYIGAVAAPMLRDAGHAVQGVDSDLFAGSEFERRVPGLTRFGKTSAT